MGGDPGFVADLFVSFLLMVFVPTLTLSIIKAIVDSAASNAGTAGLFRYVFKYFAVSTMLASAIVFANVAACSAKRNPFTTAAAPDTSAGLPGMPSEASAPVA